MSKQAYATLAMTLCFLGNANAQVRPADRAGTTAPTYAVEGIALGSKIKSDSPTYRDYKCSPSEQFGGLTWCQRTRRDSDRQGPFETSYSFAHGKDGTVLYVNRRQQPAPLDARAADRDIQGYAHKFGGQPRITKMPHRPGTDALIAAWGQVQLEPLDADGVRSLAEGKSPKKGLLIDFLGNFTRSAREGLPIYRIVGGPGFVWAGSFDQKTRGTLRFAAVDASALQPLDAAAPPAPPQSDIQLPSGSQTALGKPELGQPELGQPELGKPELGKPQLGKPQLGKPGPGQPEQPVEVQAPPREPEPASVVVADAGKDPVTVVAGLKAELSAAVQAKAEADRARAQAEKAAQEAKADADVVRKKLETARKEATAASNEVDRLRAGGAPTLSYAKITVIWVSITATLLLLIWVSSKILASIRKASSARAHARAEMVAPSEDATDAEIKLDEDDLIKQMAESLGVEDSPIAASAERPAADLHQSAADQQNEPASPASDGENPSVVIYLPDRSVSAANETPLETSASIAPVIDDVKETKSPDKARAAELETVAAP